MNELLILPFSAPGLDSKSQQKHANIRDLFKKAMSGKVLGSAFPVPATLQNPAMGTTAHDPDLEGEMRP